MQYEESGQRPESRKLLDIDQTQIPSSIFVITSEIMILRLVQCGNGVGWKNRQERRDGSRKKWLGIG
jgi:hypothetical protein